MTVENRGSGSSDTPNPRDGRQRVIAVFGDSCPVCNHSVTGAHRRDESCRTCGQVCGVHTWPPESVRRFQAYYNGETP